MKWKFSLGYWGIRLRKCINGNNPESLEIHRIVTEDDWWDFENYYTTLESDIDILNEEDNIKREDRLLAVGYDGYNPALECVNNNLKSFYDLCDYYRIFIPV